MKIIPELIINAESSQKSIEIFTIENILYSIVYFISSISLKIYSIIIKLNKSIELLYFIEFKKIFAERQSNASK